MSNLYPNAKEKFLDNTLDWVSDTIHVSLHDALAVYNSTHTLKTEVAGTEIASGQLLLARAATSGYAIASTTKFSSLTHASAVAVALIYRSTDNTLIAHIDDADQFPFTPTGGDYNLVPGGLNGSFFQL